MFDEKTEKSIAEEKRQYHKEWRAKNRDRVKRYNENYWANRTLRRLQQEEQQERHAGEDGNNDE